MSAGLHASAGACFQIWGVGTQKRGGGVGGHSILNVEELPDLSIAAAPIYIPTSWRRLCSEKPVSRTKPRDFTRTYSRQPRLIHTDHSVGVTRGKGVGERRVKGAKYMVTEDELTLGGGHTMQYTDDVPQEHTLETSTVTLAKATPGHFIKEPKAKQKLKKSDPYV